MVYEAQDFARLRRIVLAVSAVAWLVLLLEPGASAFCATPGATLSWRVLLATTPPAALARGWALMLVAMMAPTLVSALYHVRLGSFARRRAQAMACFLAGYCLVWFAAGAVLLAVELAVKSLAPGSYLPAILAGLGALLWQASPGKQVCLNRGHRHRPFVAFGLASDWNLLWLGGEHGLWCIGACSALMLFTLLLPQGHLVAMAAVTALLYCERLDRPRSPSWRWRGFGTVSRYLAQRGRSRVATPRAQPSAARG